MWKPAERIRHALPEPAWPTAGAAAEALWFQPIDVGPLRLAERTWVPAMVPWRATEDGFVTPRVLAWYERFARGEPGAIVVEATGIRDVASGPLLRAGDDRFLAGLAELAATVRRASGGRTKLLLQIIDFLSIRRRPERAVFLARYLAISESHKEKLSVEGDDEARAVLLTLADEALREVLSPREWHDLQFGARDLVTDLHLPSVRDLPAVLPELFAAAALRAERAGFDGVELHFAHAYTMASFLSPLNSRDDGYGGARENRVRLPLEVLAAVRARVGPGFAVGCRFLAEERIGVEGGGGTAEDAAFFATEFARAGVDFLSLSRGGKFEDAKQPKVGWAAYPYTGPSGYECMPTAISDAFGPFGRNVAAVAEIRRVRTLGRLRDAGRSRGRHLGLRAGRGPASGRRRGHRRGGAPVARRSRLVPQDPPGARRGGPALHLLELLRGSRPDAQAGDLPALGPRGAGRAGAPEVG